MFRRTTQSVAFNSLDPTELETHKLREELKQRRGLPVLWPIEEREDAADNIITRLLAEAKIRNVDLISLIRVDPAVVDRKVEAERSRVRRMWSKLGEQMREEMQDALPGEYVLSETESAETIVRVAEACGLTDREKQLVRLNYACGIDDNEELARQMNVEKNEIYRLRSDAIAKLRRIPDIVKPLLESRVEHAQPSPSEDGVWRKFAGRRL